ncbi:MAG TPA: hypothetical protein VKW76_16525 [Candidatus Binatia bacterium]|nr:hypothetical protein [Candidatus Binatia bacterium]
MAEPPRASRADVALGALLIAWGLGGLLPLGLWAGMADRTYYADAWGMWWRTLLLAALVAGLLLLATEGRAAAFGRRLLGRIARVPPTRFVVLLGAVAALESATVAAWCFARAPQTIDGWVQHFQARVFLSGRLTAPAPPSVGHFLTMHMLITPHGWFAQYPPVHPALLALGMALGAGWLVTPVLGGLLPAAVYHLGAASGDARVGRVAAGLAVLSPFVVAMDASAMNAVPAALCVATGLAAVPRAAAGSARAAALFGLAAGLLFGIRPLDAVLLAAVGGLGLLPALRTRRWRALAAAVATGLAAAVPTLLFNGATTGSPFTFAYSELWGTGLRLGLDHDVPWGQPLTLLRAIGNTSLDAHQLDVYLLEWPLPVTALIAAGVWCARGHLGPGIRPAAGYLLALVGTLFFYFHRDTLYGPRLLFSAVPAVLVLVGWALVGLADLRRTLPWRGLVTGDVAIGGLVVTAILAATLLAPKRLASYSIATTGLAARPDVEAAGAGIHHAVVILPDGFGSRLIARMWDLGVPMRDTPRLYKAINACDLATLLDTAERDGVRGPALLARLEAALPTADVGKYAPGVTDDPMLRLPSTGGFDPACVEELERDREGTMQFAAFVYLDAPALDGDVVWARAMGAEDERLRALFPDREIYRYTRSPEGEPRFTPLALASARAAR